MKTTLTVEIKYDPRKTDAEGLACAMDRLLETALSTPGVMDEYGNPTIGEFFVARQTSARTIRLPCYGITIALAGENSIVSDLREPETTANRRYNSVVDGLEALILAHACAGVDVTSPAYLEGIETAVDAVLTR